MLSFVIIFLRILARRSCSVLITLQTLYVVFSHNNAKTILKIAGSDSFFLMNKTIIG